jgi:hypothetical protein
MVRMEVDRIPARDPGPLALRRKQVKRMPKGEGKEKVPTAVNV